MAFVYVSHSVSGDIPGDWPWLRNVSTSATLAKGKGYPIKHR